MNEDLSIRVLNSVDLGANVGKNALSYSVGARPLTNLDLNLIQILVDVSLRHNSIFIYDMPSED